MAQQTVNNGESGLTVRGKINDNFTELYTGRELLTNKATDFSTLNNTLYPTTSAVSAYVLSLTGTSTKYAYVNDYGADATGATNSVTAFTNALASSATTIIADGLYRIENNITIPDGKTLILRGGTVISAYGTSFSLTTGCIILGNNTYILAEAGSVLERPTGQSAAYTGIYVAAKYNWGVIGRLKITGFGYFGMDVNGSAAGDNQYKNGVIDGVIFDSMRDSGAGSGYGHGHGLRIRSATEYVYIVNIQCYSNARFGLINEGGANCPIVNSKFMKNVYGGIKIVGLNPSNSDHFQVTGCVINHNDATGVYNVEIVDVDTGVNFVGCSIYGGRAMKVQNSKGITFNGCGIDASGVQVIEPGTKGDGIVRIFGGHTISAGQKTMMANLSGGGSVKFNSTLPFDSFYYTAGYESDFSAGADSWSNSGTTVTGNIDSISDGTTSFSNTLRVAGDAASSEHYTLRTGQLTVGSRYKINLTVYIPTANATCDGLRVADSGGYAFDFDPYYDIRKGKWVTVEHDFTATGTEIQLKGLSGTSVSFTMAATDYIYIARIKIFTL